MIKRYIVAHDAQKITVYAHTIDDARVIAADIWRATYDAPLPFDSTYAEIEEKPSWDEFRDLYCPIDSDGIPCRWLGEAMLNAEGTEDIIALALSDTCHIWTVIPGDSHSRIITPGVQVTNRIGYICTLYAYHNDDTFIV